LRLRRHGQRYVHARDSPDERATALFLCTGFPAAVSLLCSAFHRAGPSGTPCLHSHRVTRISETKPIILFGGEAWENRQGSTTSHGTRASCRGS